MKDAYYFPHDSNSIQDPKMMMLLSLCGPTAIALFWIIVEILHQQENGYITFEEFHNYLVFYSCYPTHTNEQVLNNCEQMLIKTGLFILENNCIYSNRVNSNKEYRKNIQIKRSLAGKKSALSRAKSTSVKQVLNTYPAAVNNEMKRNEMKSKEKERSIFPISEKAKQLEEEEGRARKGEEEKKKGREVLEFWDFFLLKTKKRFKLTRDNRRLIEDRLKSYALVDLKKVVENFVNDKWERRAEYMDLIYCIGKQRGKPDTVEHWLNKAPKKSEVRYE